MASGYRDLGDLVQRIANDWPVNESGCRHTDVRSGMPLNPRYEGNTTGKVVVTSPRGSAVVQIFENWSIEPLSPAANAG